jgi:PAT family beta-lactamase induction signal transducer AmpG
MKNTQQKKKSPWAWIPSLYLAEGLPFVAVQSVSVIMYKKMGMSNTDIALYTSLLYLPWIIKPLWSPFIDIIKTKRWWIVSMQLLLGAGFAGIAFTIPLSFYFQATMAFFSLLAFSSATHDIAADGFYMLGLDSNQQAMFVGIRSTFYRIATLLGQGALIMLAGFLERLSGNNIPFAWSVTFFILAGLFVAFSFYHRFALPKAEADIQRATMSARQIFVEFGETFVSFFKKPQVFAALFFMLTFRFSESQLLKMIPLFLIDPVDKGGLGLSTEQYGLFYGTMGIIALTLGGIIGGIIASRGGLKKWLWPMTLTMLLTAATFVYLSFSQTGSVVAINICIFIEQFGYGFGFTAYMLYLMYYSEGKYKTAHYAICTGFMALGMMLPGMCAGWIQEHLFAGSYKNFFLWVSVCSIVPLIAISLLKIDPNYGKKVKN